MNPDVEILVENLRLLQALWEKETSFNTRRALSAAIQNAQQSLQKQITNEMAVKALTELLLWVRVGDAPHQAMWEAVLCVEIERLSVLAEKAK